jgi:hypothetical protein
MRKWNHVYQNAGVPGTGTDEVQTLTIGGTPTSGTFKLRFQGETTAPITWSSTNNTLVANIDAALGALTAIGGAANVTTAVGTMTAGIGTITITFVAALGKQAVTLITVANNSLVGTDPTVEVAETTPGVNAAGVDQAPKGSLVVNTATGIWYTNTGTKAAPTWTVVGSQS